MQLNCVACGQRNRNMNKIIIVLILSSVCGLTYEFALAPATVGGLASSAGRLSNSIKVCKRFFFPNSIVRSVGGMEFVWKLNFDCEIFVPRIQRIQ